MAGSSPEAGIQLYNFTPHLTTSYSPYYLMFGRDLPPYHPVLPMYHVLGIMPSSDEDDQLDEYVASHQQRLIDVFLVPSRCSENESLKRRTRNDKSANASDLPVGCRVFVGNSRSEVEPTCRTTVDKSHIASRIARILPGTCMWLHF